MILAAQKLINEDPLVAHHLADVLPASSMDILRGLKYPDVQGPPVAIHGTAVSSATPNIDKIGGLDSEVIKALGKPPQTRFQLVPDLTKGAPSDWVRAANSDLLFRRWDKETILLASEFEKLGRSDYLNMVGVSESELGIKSVRADLRDRMEKLKGAGNTPLDDWELKEYLPLDHPYHAASEKGQADMFIPPKDMEIARKEAGKYIEAAGKGELTPRDLIQRDMLRLAERLKAIGPPPETSPTISFTPTSDSISKEKGVTKRFNRNNDNEMEELKRLLDEELGHRHPLATALRSDDYKQRDRKLFLYF